MKIRNNKIIDVEQIIDAEYAREKGNSDKATDKAKLDYFVARLNSGNYSIDEALLSKYIETEKVLNEVRLYFGRYQDYINIYHQEVISKFFSANKLRVTGIEADRNRNNIGNRGGMIYKTSDGRYKGIDIYILPSPAIDKVKLYYQMRASMLAIENTYTRIKAYIKIKSDKNNEKILDELNEIIENFFLKDKDLSKLIIFNPNDFAVIKGKNVAPYGAFITVNTQTNKKLIVPQKKRLDAALGVYFADMICKPDKKDEVKAILKKFEQWLIRSEMLGGYKDKSSNEKIKMEIKKEVCSKILSDEHSFFTQSILQSDLNVISAKEIESAINQCKNQGVNIDEVLDAKLLDEKKYKKALMTTRDMNGKMLKISYITDILDILNCEYEFDVNISEQMRILLENILKKHFMSKEDIDEGRELYINVIFRSYINVHNPFIDDWLMGMTMIDKIFRKYAEYFKIPINENIFESNFVVFRSYFYLIDTVEESYTVSTLTNNMAFFAHVLKCYSIYKMINLKIKNMNMELRNNGDDVVTTDTLMNKVNNLITEELINVYNSTYDFGQSVKSGKYLKSNRPVLTTGLSLKIIMQNISSYNGLYMNAVEDLSRYSTYNSTSNKILYFDVPPLLFSEWNNRNNNRSIKSAYIHTALSINPAMLFVGRMDKLVFTSPNVTEDNNTLSSNKKSEAIAEMQISEYTVVGMTDMYEPKTLNIRLNMLYGFKPDIVKVKDIGGKKFVELKEIDILNRIGRNQGSGDLINFFKLADDSMSSLTMCQKRLEEFKVPVHNQYCTQKNQFHIHMYFGDYRVFSESIGNEEMSNSTNDLTNETRNIDMSVFLTPEYVGAYYNLILYALDSPYILPMRGNYQAMHYLSGDFSVITGSRYPELKYEMI